jgi:hypothetical protein
MQQFNFLDGLQAVLIIADYTGLALQSSPGLPGQNMTIHKSGRHCKHQKLLLICNVAAGALLAHFWPHRFYVAYLHTLIYV